MMAFGTAYLRYPWRFPRTLEGEPWGEREVVIHFSGSAYRFTGLNRAQEAAVRERFAGFCRAFSGDAVVSRICRTPQEAFLPVDFQWRDYTFDRAYAPDRIRLAGKHFMAAIAWPKLEAAIWTSEGAEDFIIIFENVFRTLAGYHLLQKGGMILHSACVAHGGRAYLMLGRSGAGKSTFSRLALEAGWEVLSDDMNAIYLERGCWRVEKLPFAGDLGQVPGRGCTYPLAGVFRLEKGHVNALSTLRPSAAVALALSCSPIVNSDNFRVFPLLHQLKAMMLSLPTGVLRFSRDGGALDLLREEIKRDSMG
ncbi:MAG: hypothetical protein D6819_09325 [Gammaproteobacteria bacterium]|nr:MAG: hypothetical protein D6819_09325 [Gammaproteobacteria bacterium]